MRRRREFIAEKKGHHAISLLCRVVGVSNSSWYRWKSRSKRRVERAKGDARLMTMIGQLWEESKKTYGAPRVHGALKKLGVRVSRKRVARLMSQQGMYSHSHRRYIKTTVAGSTVTADLVKRRFWAEKPNQLWVGDISYIPTDEGWLYLSAILDIASRKVIGHSFAGHMKTELALTALEQAMKHREALPGLIHHTDRGCQYTSWAYQQVLMKAGIKQSMGDKGSCFDNAVAESFWASLKKELVHRQRWRTRRQAVRAINAYIRWYNNQRVHSALGYSSPEAFEQSLAA